MRISLKRISRRLKIAFSVLRSPAELCMFLQNMSRTVMMAKTAKGVQKQAAKTIKQASSKVTGAANRTAKGASKTARKTVR